MARQGVVSNVEERFMNPQNPVTRSHYDAVLFDLDGVLTDTAKMHATCWKNMFDEYLQKRADEKGEAFRPFDITTDYKLYVDGKPRFDGVRDFSEVAPYPTLRRNPG